MKLTKAQLFILVSLIINLWYSGEYDDNRKGD